MKTSNPDCPLEERLVEEGFGFESFFGNGKVYRRGAEMIFIEEEKIANWYNQPKECLWKKALISEIDQGKMPMTPEDPNNKYATMGCYECTGYYIGCNTYENGQ